MDIKDTGSEKVMTIKGVPNHFDVILMVVLVIFTASLRVSHVNDHGMWEDEALRYYIAMGNRAIFERMTSIKAEPFRIGEVKDVVGRFDDVMRLLKIESPYPPGYFMVMHATARLTGITSVADLRLWNVLFAALTVIFLYFLTRRSLPAGGAALCVLMYAFSAWDIGVCLQFKELSMTVFFATASSFYLYRIAQDPPSTGNVILYGVMTGLGCLTHYFIFFLMFLHGIYMVLCNRPRYRRCIPLIAGYCIAFVLVLPWMIYALKNQLLHMHNFNAGISKVPLQFGDVFRNVSDLLSVSILPFSLGLGRGIDAAVGIIVIALAFIGGTGLLLRERHEKRSAILGSIVYFGSLGILIAGYVVMNQRQLLWPRYQVIFMPMAWMAVAASVHAITTRLAYAIKDGDTAGSRKIAVFGLVLVICTVSFAGWRQIGSLAASPNGVDRYMNYAAVTKELASHMLSDDFIFHIPLYAASMPFIYYWELNDTLHAGLKNSNTVNIPQVLRLAGTRRVWCIYTWGFRGSFETTVVRGMESNGYRKTAHLIINSLVADRFERLPLITK